MADDTRLADACLLLNYSSQIWDWSKTTPKDSRPRSLCKQHHQQVSTSSKKPLKLVAVHLGAGNCRNESESLHIAKAICEEVMLQTSSNLISTSRKKRKSLCDPNLPESSARGCVNCRDYNSDSNKFTGDHNGQTASITAEVAVVQLIKRLEDSQSLNCGYGSNLNMKGQVECDASLMSDKTQMWAGVGSVSGCKNPILLAKCLFDHRSISRPLGLVQPNILVGSGAKQWMREHCPHLYVPDAKLISSKAFSKYQKLKSRYDSVVRSTNTCAAQRKGLPKKTANNHNNNSEIGRAFNSISDNSSQIVTQQDATMKTSNTADVTSPTCLDHGFYCIQTKNKSGKITPFEQDEMKKKSINVHHAEEEEEQKYDQELFELTDGCEDIEFQCESLNYGLDTVGAIAVDSDGNFATAISSGGLLLKYKGRIGQAAIPGAGCWSEDSVAVTTTGVGEYLTLSMFAKKFYDKIQTVRLLYDLGHVEKESNMSNLISCVMSECFDDLLNSPALAHAAPDEILAGMLSVCSLNSKDSPKRTDNNDLYLSYAHNTNSMCVGYMTSNDTTGHSVMSRRQQSNKSPNGDDGKAVVKTIKFSLDSNHDRNRSSNHF